MLLCIRGPRSGPASNSREIHILSDQVGAKAQEAPWGEARWTKLLLRGYAKQGEKRLDGPTGNRLECLVSLTTASQDDFARRAAMAARSNKDSSGQNGQGGGQGGRRRGGQGGGGSKK